MGTCHSVAALLATRDAIRMMSGKESQDAKNLISNTFLLAKNLRQAFNDIAEETLEDTRSIYRRL